MSKECDANITRLAKTHTSEPGTMQASKPGPGSLGWHAHHAVPAVYIAPGAMWSTVESAQASLDQFQSSDTYRCLI